jgi:hypothetical protein
MATLAIDRLDVRYRLGGMDDGARRRLDGALAELLEHGLDRAVERALGDAEAALCIRRLSAPIALRMHRTDQSLADEWCAAIAARIAAAARTAGSGDDVLWFRSRRAALLDVARGVARGELGRAWAWRQAGLWPAAPAAADAAAPAALAQLVAALLAQPDTILPVLAALARGGELAPLAARLDAAAWTALATAAVQAAGGPGPGHVAAVRAAPAEQVARLAAAPVARAAAAALAGSAGARLAAELAVTEAEPALLLAPDRHAAAVAAVAAAFASGAPPRPTPPATDDDARLAERDRRAAAYRPARARARARDAETDEPAELDAPRGVDDRPREDGARTGWGGLPFALWVVGALELPESALTGGPLARRSLPWTLHRLASALAPVDRRDPAALAFAGLPPDAPPPGDDERAPTPAERRALRRWRRRIVARLADELRDDEHPLPPAELVRRLCRRDAEIVADPGWIEVRLQLRDVTPAVRRAGLDLDPGYLPWLGVVVRFVYA